MGDRGEGGGIYTGAAAGPTSLELAEVTVAGNSVGAGGQFAGIAGDPQDDLVLWNSIVYTGGAGDIGGFDSFDIRYSDACTSAGQPFTGGTSVGNICADPKLVGGADVHQTTLSPTIDKGSDELFNMVGGERANEDYEGDPRPTDGDGDGHTVDMGADESPAFVAPPPPPPPTPQCSDLVDNDGDGAIDAADPGCLPGPTDNNEGDETPGDLVLCGQRTISLVRRGRRRQEGRAQRVRGHEPRRTEGSADGSLPRPDRQAEEARLGHARRRRPVPGAREEAAEAPLQ